MPTTHTMNVNNAKDVFLKDDAGLRCIDERDPMELARNYFKWKECLEIGLECYVFTYLGIHDPSYAMNHWGAPTIPVGIFIDRRTENKSVVEANATFRDLHLNHLKPNFIDRPFEKWLVSAPQARSLCMHEVRKVYANNFWEYWGDPDSASLKSPTETDTLWTRFYEFHLLYLVAPEDFAAVLWPIEIVESPEHEKSLTRFLPPYEGIVTRFPNLTILTYLLPRRGRERRESFFRASFEAAKHFADHHCFPDSLPLHLEYMRE